MRSCDLSVRLSEMSARRVQGDELSNVHSMCRQFCAAHGAHARVRADMFFQILLLSCVSSWLTLSYSMHEIACTYCCLLYESHQGV